jgi:uncharacterized protein with FMN-binding domain
VKRVALTVLVTVVGLVLLLQFKVHATKPTIGQLAVLTPSTAASGSSRHTHSSVGQQPRPSATHSSAAARPTTSQAPAGTPTHHQAVKPAAKVITGQTVQTRYGPVQIRIVETGHTLSNVTALQLPNADPHSQQIAAAAAPILRREALQANSARIDVVSGATYTSNGYAQSLQSALDHA